MFVNAAEPWLRHKAADLLEAARDNMPIDLEAERLLVALDKKFKLFISRQDLKAWLSHPDWWSYVMGFAPQFEPYRAWVDDLRQELLDMLTEDDSKQSAKDEATGDE
jgi:hypothetical protein